MNIPFNIPYIPKSINDDNFKKIKNIGVDGKYTKIVEKLLKKKYNSKNVILTHSCTAALEICALLLELKKDDEILLPSFSFVSVANAFALRNAKLKFLDVSKETLNLKYEDIKKNINKKTKAIVVVHYAGYSEDIDKIAKLAKKKRITLIEDCAHSIFTKFKKKYLGTFGDLSTFSFHETKNLHCGTGGALIINNKKFIEKANIIANKGTNRHLFNSKKVSKYSWVSLGSSYKINELSSFFLYNVIKDRNIIKKRRISAWNFYYKHLSKLDESKKIKLPKYNFNNNENAAHIFYFLVKRNFRSKLIRYLKSNKISATFHYIPLCSAPYFNKYAEKKNFTSELISNEIIRLPIYPKLNEKQQNYIITKIYNFFELN